jgi:cytochrome P450
LRLRSASAAARAVTKDVEVKGYILRKGSVVLLPVRLMHFDSNIFPDPDKFEPERWTTSLTANTDERLKQAAMQSQRKQNASLRSFGGGTGLCSGRFVAEYEILSSVATILLLFDIEFENGEDNFQLNPRSLGIMRPLRDPKVRYRRRKGPRMSP